MKRIFYFVTLITLVLTACEGVPGPPGLDGLNGLDGKETIADAFQLLDVDFISSDDFQVTYEGFDFIESDVALVYLKWELEDGTITWRQLPQTIFFDNDILVYNFDFTQDTVTLFLDGTIVFNSLDSSLTQNQEFRVVIVPANQVSGIDTSDISIIMALGNIETFEVR
ncbi:hypothetical protein N8341_01170 [Flavobacteriaceae bacterium]|nr:hypothetical protein [Flavobacteriaceae bacterium]